MPGTGARADGYRRVSPGHFLIISAFAALVSSGGAPRASIFMGQGDNESAEKTLSGCFMPQIIIPFFLTAILLLWNRNFCWPSAPVDKHDKKYAVAT